jgi:hypothetical protein
MKFLNIKTRRTRLNALVAALGASLLIVACGGGGGDAGGGGGPGGTPVPPQAWQGTLPLESEIGQADTPKVAVNANGIAYAIWAQVDGKRTKIFASRYIDGAWQEALVVSKSVELNQAASSPQIVVHPDGTASAIWTEPQFFGNELLASSTDQDGQWKTEVSLESAVTFSDLKLESDGEGTAVAIWRKDNSKVNASVFSAGQFGAVETLSLNTQVEATVPSVSMVAGKAVAVWAAKSGPAANPGMFARVFQDGKWEANVFILSNPVGPEVLSTDVSVQADGKAVATWSEKVTGGAIVSVRNASNAFGFQWAPSGEIVGPTGNNFTPVVATDTQGRAVVVWEQQTAGKSSFSSSRFDGTRWNKGPVDLSAGDAQQMQLGMDGSGRAIAVWTQSIGALSHIMSNRMDPVTGEWGTPELIENEDRGSAFLPSVAVSSRGLAVANWNQRDGTRDGGVEVNSIVANVFK